MNRRRFLTLFGIGVGAAAVVPSVLGSSAIMPTVISSPAQSATPLVVGHVGQVVEIWNGVYSVKKAIVVINATGDTLGVTPIWTDGKQAFGTNDHWHLIGSAYEETSIAP